MIKTVKKIIYISFILIVIIFLSIFIVFKYKTESDKTIKKSINVEISEPIKEYKYILKEYQGKLAVFEIDKKDPEMVFDVLIDSLPEIDVIALKKGLKIKDENELNERIEDFIS